MNIAFVGGGVMAEAIIGGILDGGLATPQQVRVGEPFAERRSQLSDRYSVAVTQSNLEALDGAELVVLSVKPQQLSGVMAEIGPGLGDDHTVVSIVAGVRMGALVSELGHSKVVRVMPNTPAQVRAGMTVWTASNEVPEEMVAATGDILRTLGQEVYVTDEKLIDMATALSASGPAYVFLFIEAMIDAGVYLGMQRDMARKLVLQTVLGSTELVEKTGRHPAELRDMVTSPGGTTAEALAAFERAGFRRAVLDAVIAAYEKSRALGGPG